MPHGVKLLKFWVEVNTFKNFLPDKIKENFVPFSDKLYHNYMKSSSPCYLEFPNNLNQEINRAHSFFDHNMVEECIEECMDYTVDTLRGYYYVEFCKSDNFKNLLILLENDEKIYSKLFKIHMFHDAEQLI